MFGRSWVGVFCTESHARLPFQRTISVTVGAPPLTRSFVLQISLPWKHGGYAGLLPTAQTMPPSFSSIVSPALWQHALHAPVASMLSPVPSYTVSETFLKCGIWASGPKPQYMQHGINVGARQKQMRLSTILAVAPSSDITNFMLIEAGAHLFVPQEMQQVMQLAHPLSHVPGVIVCPS